MLSKVVENNLIIQGKVVVVNNMNFLGKSILIKGKPSMTSFVHEKGELMFEGQDLEKLVLEPLKVGSKELKSLFLGLSTKGNPCSLLDILHLK